MTDSVLIAGCELQWQYVGDDHAACRYCAFIVWMGADATIEEHMNKCGPLAKRKEEQS